MVRSLERLLRPRGIAVVGASERNHYARVVIENLQSLGYDNAALQLVNPGRPTAFGMLCAPQVSELPTVPDLAVVVVRSEAVLGVIEDCGLAGVGGALIMAEGFAESGAGGRELQERLREAGVAHDLVICGPNSLGFVSPDHRLGTWGIRLPKDLVGGSCGVVFQSSGLLNLFIRQAAFRGLGVSTALSTGNEADLTLAEGMRYLIADTDTSVIAIMVESVADAPEFIEALKAAQSADKPVIVLRSGRSERSRTTVLAHAGRLASPGRVWDAVLKQFGAICVTNIDDLMEHALAFSILPATKRSPLGGGSALCITISGGDVSYMVDLAEQEGLRLATPRPQQAADLASIAGKELVSANPLDVENWPLHRPELFWPTLEYAVKNIDAEIVVARLFLPSEPNVESLQLYERIAELLARSDKVLAIVSRASEQLSPAWFQAFGRMGVPFLQEYQRGFRAIAAWLRGREDETSKIDAPSEALATEPNAGMEDALRNVPVGEMYRLIEAGGIEVAPYRIVDTLDDAQAAAAEIGFPVAVKLIPPSVAHKSDHGLVKLDVRTAQGVTNACDELREAAAKLDLQMWPRGGTVLVQSMVEGMCECFIGMKRDDALGPVVTFGLGGVFVEIFDDIAMRVAPFTRDDAKRMVDELKGAALLKGARGRPPADLERLYEALVDFSNLVVAAPESIKEIDVNPLIVRAAATGAPVAVDALGVEVHVGDDRLASVSTGS